MLNKRITLKHLLINKEKCIGIQYYSDKTLDTLVKSLKTIAWSDEFSMYYLVNTPENFNAIFELFKGYAWINCGALYPNKRNTGRNPAETLKRFYNRKKDDCNYRFCPNSYVEKLELKRYSLSTAKSYISSFKHFINYYPSYKLLDISEEMIRDYLLMLVKEGKSDSYLNQAVNSIKFYYEIVEQMPNRFYSIDRPRKKERLPKVLSKQEVKKIIDNTNNIKHKCIICNL